MSKINHSRPSLRHLDNFRRELTREGLPRSHWLDENKTAVAQKAVNRDPLTRHIARIEDFPPAVQKTLERLLAAFHEAEEAWGEVIVNLMGGNSKKRKFAKTRDDAAREELVVAGAVFLHQNFDEILVDRSAAWDWLRAFLPLMKNYTRMAWHDFLTTIILDESLALCVAEKVSSTPEEVNRLRLLFAKLPSE